MLFSHLSEAAEATDPKSKVGSDAMFGGCNTNTDTSARVAALGVDERHRFSRCVLIALLWLGTSKI